MQVNMVLSINPKPL